MRKLILEFSSLVKINFMSFFLGGVWDKSDKKSFILSLNWEGMKEGLIFSGRNKSGINSESKSAIFPLNEFFFY